MTSIESLRDDYEALDRRLEARADSGVDPDCLLTFEYDYPEGDSEVVIDTQEFTAVCPWNELPDFGSLKIEYVPDRQCIELKSLKLYLWSYRDEGIFFEAATNRILDDLVAACQPRRLQVVGNFNVRGGIGTVVSVDYIKAEK